MPIGSRVIQAVGVMPFAGRSHARRMYREGLRAASAKDQRAALEQAKELDNLAKVHYVNLAIGAPAVASNVALSIVETRVPPVVHTAATAIAGVYVLANIAVVYTQKTMSRRVKDRAEALPAPSPIDPAPETAQADTGTTQRGTKIESLTESVASARNETSVNYAYDSPDLDGPTRGELLFTRLGHTANAMALGAGLGGAIESVHTLIMR